ncbi:MAG: bifunctional chorismate mutase/prephenate dehydrogenase [Phycisphaerae bacterium]|nr:bifunctional chorismate mutase/prephenate dehydrogenase [Phycisphaerae bacterium]
MTKAKRTSENPAIRPLPVLRAMIDAIDRDILQLLARRNGLIADIAEHKREHHLPIRDLDREREIIADRRSRAMTLGLNPELIESLFRLVLWASRDRQAALKAEVPLEVEPRTVAVIGGRRGMGQCIAQLFGDLGHAVMIADLDTALTPDEAAAVADVVIVAVPIDVTEDVIRRIGPRVRPEALLMDVTSIKTGPLRAMLAASRASVVGTHPLFGPTVHSLQGQRVVLTPGRGDQWLAWLRSMLHARGIELMETTPEEHDRAMSIVQVLVHFSTEVMGKTLATLQVPIDRTLLFTSPIYLMELLLTARHFAQSPALYAAIQMSNPDTAAVTAAFARAAEELRTLTAAQDHAAFDALFAEVRQFFGPFTTRALEQSDFLIDRLVERA